MLSIKRIVNFDMDQNCYLVYAEDKEAVIIDPGSSAKIIIDKLKEENVNLKYILLTHCHYDHIEGLKELREETKAKVVSTFECNQNIQNPNVNLSSLFSFPIKEEPSDVILNDNDILEMQSFNIKMIKTPGHTNGGCCYLIDNDLFSGDTLFLMSVGRWDFPTGDEEILQNSIKNKIYSLDDEVIVHPGHGNDTKVYYEKRYNNFVKG